MKIINAMTIACMLTAASASAQNQDRLQQVDNLLDRLEKRLLDGESDGLTFGEKLPQPPSAAGNEDATSASYKFEKDQVQAHTGEQEQLKGLSHLVADLEQQVDQLAANVQKTKQSILDEAAIDNFAAIDAALSDTDAAAIKSLTIKLDGYPIYELQEASSLWLPSKAVPLYAGPLQPGNHRLDLEARIALRQPKTLPLSSDVYRLINQTFDLTMPGGTVNRHWTITITPPETLDGSVQAAIKEVH